MQTSMSFRLPKELALQLGELAKSTGRSKSFLAVKALKDFIDREYWQVSEIEQALREADAGDFCTEEEMKALEDKWSPRAR